MLPINKIMTKTCRMMAKIMIKIKSRRKMTKVRYLLIAPLGDFVGV